MIIVIFPKNSCVIHFINKNVILLSSNWIFFSGKAIKNIGIYLACVICGAEIVKFPEHFSLFFKRQR